MWESDRDYLVDLKNLGESILDYSKISSDVLEIINSSKASVEKLCETGWEGEAQEKFREDFDTWIEEANAFINNVSQLENSLKVMYTQAIQLKDEGGDLSIYL